MKKYLLFGALIALLLGTTACNDQLAEIVGDGEEVEVQFTTNFDEGIDSRAISDGTKADRLLFLVYENGSEVSALRQLNVPVVDKKATVTTKLVKGHTYSFVFFAVNSTNGLQFWGVRPADGTVTIREGYNANPIKCNDDNADAFYNVLNDFTVTGSFSEDVTLRRPFAQINILADDAASLTEADIANYESNISGWINGTRLPGTMNFLTGEVSGTSLASLMANSLPTESVPGYEQYRLIATRYVIAPVDRMIVGSLNFDLGYGNSHRGLTLTNIPIQRNYRTNIIGSFFSEDVTYRVEIDPIYNNGDPNEVQTLSERIQAEAAVPNATVEVPAGSNVSLNLGQIADGVTINGNGSVLLLNRANCTLGSDGVTIQGFTVKNTETYSADIIVEGSNFTLKDAVMASEVGHNYGIWFKNLTDDGVYNLDNVVFNEEFISRVIVPECKGTVNVSNSKIQGGIYSFSTVNVAGDCDLNIANTVIENWTSWDLGANKTINIDGCSFVGDSDYGFFRPYGNGGTNTVYIKNSTFSNDYYGINAIDGVKIYITNSTLANGAALTSRKFFDPDNAYTLTANGLIYLDGTLVYDGPTIVAGGTKPSWVY